MGYKKISMLILVLISFIAFSGCITSNYHKSNQRYKNARREFRIPKGKSVAIFKGLWAGEETIDGKVFYRLLFNGVLKGKNRYLHIMVQKAPQMRSTYRVGQSGHLEATGKRVEMPGLVIVRESEFHRSGPISAYLVLRFSAIQNMKAFYAIFNQKRGEKSSPVAIMKTYYNYTIPKEKYPLALVYLDFSNIFKYSINAVIWKMNDGGKPVVSCNGTEIDKYDGPHMIIDWKVRKKLFYALRQAGYIGTVIGDIVTSPVQLIMLILEMQVGPVVR